ncbi:MAG: hypothetical protein SOX82_04705 [Eubacteriales bacterium]|nr:hypothetical protein [Eubacteriales bacterium]
MQHTTLFSILLNPMTKRKLTKSRMLTRTKQLSHMTYVYDAANLTADDITKNVKVEFEKVIDSEYDIILKATEANKKNQRSFDG